MIYWSTCITVHTSYLAIVLMREIFSPTWRGKLSTALQVMSFLWSKTLLTVAHSQWESKNFYSYGKIIFRHRLACNEFLFTNLLSLPICHWVSHQGKLMFKLEFGRGRRFWKSKIFQNKTWSEKKWENKVSMMFIISLGWNKLLNLAHCTAKYRPLNWPLITHRQ